VAAPFAATPDLLDLEARVREFVADLTARPLRHMKWTPPQQAFYLDPSLRKSFRAGNQIGKTYAGLRLVIDLAMGRHPTQQFRPPPLECWIVCTSWSQSVAIMRKAHDLIELDTIDQAQSSRFSIRSGWGKDNPCLVLHNGSVIRFRTTNQGATAFQGSTIHVVLIDEPTDLDIYRELDRRLLRTGGVLGITFTPANRDCRWLREITESGIISETHAKLTEANLTPAGEPEPMRLHDGTLMDSAWVAAQWASTPALFADVVLDGMWEGKPVGLFFKNFDKARHVSAQRGLDARGGPVRWVLGVDHATAAREQGQVAVLSKVQQFSADGRTREAIVVMDEVVMSGASTSEQFAAEVANMLRRRGISWRDLYQAWGDNSAYNRWVVKSNQEVERALARNFGMAVGSMRPRIQSAKEGKGAAGMLDAGCRYLYEALGDEEHDLAAHLVIHPRCTATIDAFETWPWGDAMHPAKDRIDALRYSLRSFIFPAHTSNVSVRVG